MVLKTEAYKKPGISDWRCRHTTFSVVILIFRSIFLFVGNRPLTPSYLVPNTLSAMPTAEDQLIEVRTATILHHCLALTELNTRNTAAIIS